MKNEVKKKMMLHSRKSWHQSHAEEISLPNVNQIFSAMHSHGLRSFLYSASQLAGAGPNCADSATASRAPACSISLA
jgi:hypothetical protein